jgi:putative oxygen-independent coproporphyrinogen III oxidase
VSSAPFGVYFHVPFCVSRCDYCAFATWTDRFHLVDEYVAALAQVATRQLGSERPVTSVFLGGGTPSLLSPAHIKQVLDVVPLASEAPAEVTVECNPESVDEEKLLGYRAAGVNRLSFGVQSMTPHVLDGLGRRHDPGSVRRAVSAAAAAGFGASYSVDLIMGGAGETLEDWQATVEAVLGLDPPPVHLSAYGLTVEPGTPLASDPARHPDPDDQADKYLFTDQRLVEAGLAWYEISNWSRPGAECRHNQLYWSQEEYEGIGCAAHSHRIDPDSGLSQRWWNVRTPERWMALVGAGGTGRSAGETLEPEEARRERLQLSLRTANGVPVDALPGWPDDEVLDGLVQEEIPGRLVLTPRGRLLANEVALRMV